MLTPAEENGDFSALLPATQLVSPYTGLPYPNNQIPVNAVAQSIAKAYMPLPNTNVNGHPTFGNIRLADFEGTSIYEGLNIHFQHRLSHNLELSTVYSWSHLRDNQGTDTNSGGSFTQIPGSKEWATGLNDQRNSLAVAFVWGLPRLTAGDTIARNILNGWGLNAITGYKGCVATRRSSTSRKRSAARRAWSNAHTASAPVRSRRPSQ